MFISIQSYVTMVCSFCGLGKETINNLFKNQKKRTQVFVDMGHANPILYKQNFIPEELSWNLIYTSNLAARLTETISVG